jgi:hypothetical protein
MSSGDGINEPACRACYYWRRERDCMQDGEDRGVDSYCFGSCEGYVMLRCD